MDGWVSLWGWLLVVVIVMFAGLVIVIAIGGLRDIRDLFRTIDAQHEAEDRERGQADS